MHGFYIENYPEGNPKTTGYYKNGAKDSIWSYYIGINKMSKQEIFKGETTLILNFWDKDGNQTVKDSNGVLTSYYKNGQIEETGPIKSGLPHGFWKRYYNNGQLLSSGNYQNGIETGKWVSQYRNGSIKSVINYESGMNERYYQNGQKEMEGILTDEKKEGVWKYWYFDGHLWRVGFHL